MRTAVAVAVLGIVIPPRLVNDSICEIVVTGFVICIVTDSEAEVLIK